MVCKICFSTTITLEKESFEMQYTYCPTCHLIVLREAFFLTETQQRQRYEKHHNTIDNPGYVKMLEHFLDYVWQNPSLHMAHCLEFGSGPTPVLAYLLRQRGAHVDCYDRFFQPDLVYEGKSYDMITATEVFEHLEAPLYTLQFFHRYLKKGGIVGLMTHFHANNAEHFWQWWYRRDPTHIAFYTPKTFDVMAQACGFKVLRCDEKNRIVLQKQ